MNAIDVHVPNELPHCFNDDGVCVYCDRDEYELDQQYMLAVECGDGELPDEQCDARARFEAQR